MRPASTRRPGTESALRWQPLYGGALGRWEAVPTNHTDVDYVLKVRPQGGACRPRARSHALKLSAHAAATRTSQIVTEELADRWEPDQCAHWPAVKASWVVEEVAKTVRPLPVPAHAHTRALAPALIQALALALIHALAHALTHAPSPTPAHPSQMLYWTRDDTTPVETLGRVRGPDGHPVERVFPAIVGITFAFAIRSGRTRHHIVSSMDRNYRWHLVRHTRHPVTPDSGSHSDGHDVGDLAPLTPWLYGVQTQVSAPANKARPTAAARARPGYVACSVA